MELKPQEPWLCARRIKQFPSMYMSLNDSIWFAHVHTQGNYDMNHYRLFFLQLTDTGCYSSVMSSSVWNDRHRNNHICYSLQVCLQKKSRLQTSDVLLLKTAIFVQLAQGLSFLFSLDYVLCVMKWITSKTLLLWPAPLCPNPPSPTNYS